MFKAQLCRQYRNRYAAYSVVLKISWVGAIRKIVSEKVLEVEVIMKEKR